jgi:hypothetical protein
MRDFGLQDKVVLITGGGGAKFDRVGEPFTAGSRVPDQIGSAPDMLRISPLQFLF